MRMHKAGRWRAIVHHGITPVLQPEPLDWWMTFAGAGKWGLAVDTQTAQKLLSKLPGEFGRRAAVQFGQAFVFGADAAGQAVVLPGGRPPLATLAANEVALKVYLTLVLMTKTPPNELYRPRMVAELAETLAYDLLTPPDYSPGPGTRRVRRALERLHALGLIKLTTSRGQYQVTVTHMPDAEQPPFISVPIGLWSHGWILRMRSPALAVYLYLRLAGARNGRPVAIDPIDRDRTDLSADTFARGLKQLAELGILNQRPAVIEDRYGRRQAHTRACLIDDARITFEDPAIPTNTESDWDARWAAARI